MTTQSGIVPTEELLSAWAKALTGDSVRLIQIQIESEKLVPKAELPPSSTQEADFSLIDPLALPATPSYFLYKLDSPASWIFFSYCPDDAPVRQKMLYASSRNTLMRHLGDSRFETSIFATDKNDLTHASYLAHLSHQSSDAPLTTREQEMADLKKAEQQEQESTEPSIQKTVFASTGAVGLAWSDEALEEVAKLKDADNAEDRVVQLEIDMKKEVLVPSSPQPTSLSLPTSTPCFVFFKHEGSIVYIYSCPPSSSVKYRLVYSSSSRGIAFTASDRLGLTVAKRIETSSPEEIDLKYIEAELGTSVPTSSSTPGDTTPSGGNAAPLPEAPKAFARPARPGRR